MNFITLGWRLRKHICNDAVVCCWQQHNTERWQFRVAMCQVISLVKLAVHRKDEAPISVKGVGDPFWWQFSGSVCAWAQTGYCDGCLWVWAWSIKIFTGPTEPEQLPGAITEDGHVLQAVSQWLTLPGRRSMGKPARWSQAASLLSMREPRHCGN